MTTNSCPTLVSPIRSFAIKQRDVINLDLSEHFAPRDGSLEFSLLRAPTWLKIEKNSGLCIGTAPGTLRAGQCLVTVKAENAAGFVTESFLVKIVTSDFIAGITRPLLDLKLWMPKDEFTHQSRTTHEILRYIYEYFRQSKEWEIFVGLLQEEASKLNINVSNPIFYNDFKNVARALNPNAEMNLRAVAEEDHLITEIELENEEMQRLFRQGSQPQGVYPRQVFNYIGAPSLNNLSAVKTVLRAGVAAIIKLHQDVDRNELQHAYSHAPTPTLRPPDWPKG